MLRPKMASLNRKHLLSIAMEKKFCNVALEQVKVCTGGPNWEQVQVMDTINSLRPSDAYMLNKLTIIGSDNALSPGRRQAIIWTSAEILLIGPLGTNISGILICHLRNGVHLSPPQCVNRTIADHVQ